MALVDPAYVVSHLREDPGTDVSIYLGAAEERAIAFLGRQVYPDIESLTAAVEAGTAGDAPMVVNNSFKAAVLLLVGHLWANRETVVVGSSVGAIRVPLGAEELLWPFRTQLGI